MVHGNKKKQKNRHKKNKIKKAKTPLQNDKTKEYESLNDQETESQQDEGVDSEIGIKSNKRQFEDDSDNEDKPRKKKKKTVTTETTDKKVKKSIRQIKKEKFAQRQAETEAAAKDQLKSQCLNYLSQWKNNKQDWKFMKAKQVWLYKNKFSTQLIPDASWPIFLEYFESAMGNIRNMLLDDANKIIKQMDEWTESQNNDKVREEKDEKKPKTEESVTEVEIIKPDDTTYKRARDLIQCLQE